MWGKALALLLAGALSGTAVAAQQDTGRGIAGNERPGVATAYRPSLPEADPVKACTRATTSASLSAGFRDRMIAIAPLPATAPDETHAALMVSREAFQGHVTFAGDTFIDRQLRTGSPANPWETAWLVWHFSDNDHFYYFALKTNGWELGKRDPAYPGGQRFLATGDDIAFATGTWYGFRISQTGATMTVALDGREIVTFTDREAAYGGGRLGIYSEDARVRLDRVAGSLSDDFETYDTQPLRDGARLGETWEVAFLGYGEGIVMSERLDLSHLGAFEPAHEAHSPTPSPAAFAPTLAAR